jgi:hypothetical protein
MRGIRLEIDRMTYMAARLIDDEGKVDDPSLLDSDVWNRCRTMRPHRAAPSGTARGPNPWSGAGFAPSGTRPHPLGPTW